jgi:hypothetical protein
MEEVVEEGIIWDRPHYFFKGVPYLPQVYEGPLDDIPSDCNAVMIQLDGTTQADLSWKKEQVKAKELVESGYTLFWDIDLGLFDRLTMPLDHQGQFLSLTLSLEHFRDTLWKEFKDKTLGICIYRGNLDFSKTFSWDIQQIDNLKNWLKTLFQHEQAFENETGLPLKSFSEAAPANLLQNENANQLMRLFCRDATVEYLSLLATRLPDALPCYLFLDGESFAAHPLWEAQLLNPEKFDLLNLALKNVRCPWNAWDWEVNKFKKNDPLKAKVGICFPPMDMYRAENFAGLQQALEVLLQQGIPFKIIAENHLISCWDGLDDLIYVPTGLSSQGKRKLQGFCAAGGTVVTVSHPLGLSHEISFDQFVHASHPFVF